MAKPAWVQAMLDLITGRKASGDKGKPPWAGKKDKPENTHGKPPHAGRP